MTCEAPRDLPTWACWVAPHGTRVGSDPLRDPQVCSPPRKPPASSYAHGIAARGLAVRFPPLLSVSERRARGDGRWAFVRGQRAIASHEFGGRGGERCAGELRSTSSEISSCHTCRIETAGGMWVTGAKRCGLGKSAEEMRKGFFCRRCCCYGLWGGMGGMGRGMLGLKGMVTSCASSFIMISPIHVSYQHYFIIYNLFFF